MYSRKREEFLADFYVVTRRVLTPFEFQLFRYTFLLGADYNLCCRYLEMDRGDYFHAVYRIEEKLGREFAELQPYPLYPIDEYFGGTVRKQALPALPPIRLRQRNRSTLRLPLTA